MTLETFQTLFTVFLVLTIVLFVLSIVFFFVFDIRKIFSIKTGRAVRKSVKELNAINRSEDNRNRKKYKGRSIQLSKELTEGIKESTDEMMEGTTQINQFTESILVTAQLGDIATTVLASNENTSVLEEKMLVTSTDSQEDVPVHTPIMEGIQTQEEIQFEIVARKIVKFSNEIIQKTN